jgi:hypothetical protein
MKLEYRHGVRISKLVHEMSPLEAAIHQYEEMAKKHYSKASDKKTTLTDKERKAKLKEALSFLELERGRLNTIADVQGQLDQYREAGMQAVNGVEIAQRSAMSMMRSEKHHPTKVLEEFMRAEGQTKPSIKHTAHHIVPGRGKLRVLTAQTRIHLHLHGIRINDPANGVYLVHDDADTPHWSMPKSKGHLRYHTHDYERWVSQKITPHTNMDFIKTQLQIIGRLLQDNEPKNAIPTIKNNRAIKS